jgi:dihydropteroate synthase
MYWQTARFRLDITQPRVMGIVNITPDSFSGSEASGAAALERCRRLLDEGADLLDLGAESSRPGATPVGADEELARLLPVLEGAVELGCPISIDTCKPEVMQEVLARGADIINDIGALQAPGALDAVAASACGVCLMHMRGTPTTMQQEPVYDDVVAEVGRFLRERGQALREHGIEAERIVYDPGIGFGKTPAHNLELLRRQRELIGLVQPLLVGWSRKSTLGKLTGRGVAEREAASVAAALAAVELGARIVRVHDVAATVDGLRVWRAAGLGSR